jgi:hypothetical protein
MPQGIVINISGSGEGAAEALRQIEAKMQETAERGESSAAQIGEAWEKLEGILGSVGIGVGLTEGIEKIKEMITSSMELGVQLEHMSQATGMSAETLSVLHYAAAQNGVDFETLSKGFKKLSTAAYEADGGNKAALASFGALGITQADLKAKGNDLYAVLELVADKFSEMPDGIEKNALATKLFGKSAQDLIPLLNQGSAAMEEMKAKAPIFSEADIGKMEEMHKSTAALSAAWQQMSLELTSAVAPALTGYIDHMLAAKAANEAQTQSFKDWLAIIRTDITGAPALDLGKHFVPGAPSSLMSLPEKPRAGAGDGAGSSSGNGHGHAFTVDTSPNPDPFGDEMRESVLVLEDAYQHTIELQAQVGQGLQMALGLEQAMNDAVKQRADDLADYQKRVASQGSSIDDQFGQKQDESAAGGDKVNAQAAKQAANTVGGFMNQLTEQAVKGKLGFKSMVDSAVMDLERFAMKVIEERSLIPLMNSLFGIGGSAGGLGGTGSASAQAANMNIIEATGFATGGDYKSGWAVVGDGGDGSGSELFAPKTPGTILPHEVLEGLAKGGQRGSGGAPSVTVNNINNSSSPVQMKQAGVSWDAQARQFIIHTVLEDMQQGGPMSTAMQGFGSK